MRASDLVADALEVTPPEARRMIQQGAILLDDERIFDPDQRVKQTAEVVLRRGNAGAIDHDMY